MGYDADWDGQVTITPPLTWPQIKNAPKLRDLELVREETTTDTETGQTLTITASVLQPKSGWGAYAGSSIEPELNSFLAAFPDHEFTGAITADGPEGNHWRYVIQGREVVYQTPRIVWPGEEPTGAPATDTLPQWLARRFGKTTWDEMSPGDQSFWEHEAAAVRRAVERGGFKRPMAGEATP